MNARSRALRFNRAVTEAIVDEAVPFDRGTVLRTPSLPRFWALNAVRLEGPEPDLDLAGAAALAAEHEPHMPGRHVLVDDEATADRLMPLARAAGWTVEHEVDMALTGEPGPPADRSAVREGTLEEVVALLDAWMREDFSEQGREAVDQLVEGCRRQHERLPWRRFVATDSDDRVVGMCSVLVRDGVAQVEDVYVLPEARGRGLGRAVTAAVVEEARAAGPELVFIIADADDWPQRLYGGLGFTPVGRRAALHLPVA